MTSAYVENMQKTIKNEIGISGHGLFSGKEVSLTLKPARENHGIVFKRIDLPNAPAIYAKVNSVKKTPRCTILGNDDITILMVEHLLSALYAYEIDNLLIEIYGPEIPACDGSSKHFVDLLEKAKVVTQNEKKKLIKITKPIYWTRDQVQLIALPSDRFVITYILHYPDIKPLKSQYFTTCVDKEIYKKEISPSRTFSVYEEIKPLVDQGLIKGGGLNNAVIIKENKILNSDGVRFSDEMARHKVLDLIGDLSLLGGKILGHIIAIRSGHFSNVSFAKKILNVLKEDEKINERERINSY